MADNFYAEWFNRTQPPRPTQEEIWERNTQQLRRTATSEFGEYCKSRFKVPEVDEAEAALKAVLQEISDPELRNRVDMAAGKISYAYEILGFCARHFSQDSRSSTAFFLSPFVITLEALHVVAY